MGPRELFRKRCAEGNLFAGSNYIIASDRSVWVCIVWALGGIADIHQYDERHPAYHDNYRFAVSRDDTLFAGC